jgi:glycosyltransferase involved in cell wall biosynthesis
MPVVEPRVVNVRVSGQRLVLQAQLDGRPRGDGSRAPDEFVLHERRTGRQVRVALATSGSGAEVVADVEVGQLLAAQAPSTWDVRATPNGGDAAAGCDVVSDLDATLTPSAFIPQGERLYRVRPRSTRSGRLEIAVVEMPPHAEVGRVLVQDGGLAVEAVLCHMPPPPPGTTASLVASLRGRDDEVTAPAELRGSEVRGVLPLVGLGSDVAKTEYWDLSLRVEGAGTLRLAGHLDGVADKKTAYVFPKVTLPFPSGSRSLQPYFTVNNGLSVRSRPVNAGAPTPSMAPGPPVEQAMGDSWQKAVQRRLLHVVRSSAVPLARTIIRRFPARRPVPSTGRGRPRISILIVHGYGMGGTVRTVFNQAAYLGRAYDVEILSQFRARKQPFFPQPSGVALTPLDDRTEAGRERWPVRLLQDRLSRMPSLLVHEADVSFERCSLWTDVQLVRRLRRHRGGILMATRPSLNLLAAQLAAPGVITVGQEHMNFQQHRHVLAVDLHREYRRLDALTVLTYGDLEDYTRTLFGSGTCVVRIPNSLTPLTGGPADPRSKVVVAAGRLTHQKGFDRLIPAFEQVLREHPDWTLRIYGSGPHRRRLERLVVERGLYNNVLLMGRAERMGDELAQGSVYVLSSRFEGFGMVLIEAMSKGMAVVSFDCPRGPADLITHGVDGLLVPNGDVDALARAILDVVGDEDRRRRLGVAAVESAGRYNPEVVGGQWDDLFDRLLVERSPSWWPPRSAT